MRVSIEALEIELGIGPVSLFPPRISCCRFGSEWPMFDGRLPKRLLAVSERTVNEEILMISGGITPVSLLLDKANTCRPCRLPISPGISPATS